jgi:hypothetical protein
MDKLKPDLKPCAARIVGKHRILGFTLNEDDLE